MKKFQTHTSLELIAFDDPIKTVFVNAYTQLRDGFEVSVRAHWRKAPRRQSLH